MGVSEPATLNDQLNAIRARLTDVVGGDLADSLVRAGRKNGAFDLDLHLLISDGVKALSAEQKREVLSILDELTAQQ
jgi:hypothetical protein